MVEASWKYDFSKKKKNYMPNKEACFQNLTSNIVSTNIGSSGSQISMIKNNKKKLGHSFSCWYDKTKVNKP